MKGKPLAERIRAEVAEEVKKLGHIGLVTVLVGDDPASDVYIRLKHKAATEAGFDATDLRLPAETTEADLLAKLDGAERLRRRRRDPRAAAAARAHRRGADHSRRRAGEGRRRLPPAERGRALPRPPAIVSATPLGVMALLARAPRRARRRARRRDRPQRDRRQAGGAPAAAGERDRDALPLAHAGSRRATRSTPTCSSPRSASRRSSPPDMVKAGAVVVDVGMNRTEAGLVGDVDPGAARGRGAS